MQVIHLQRCKELLGELQSMHHWPCDVGQILLCVVLCGYQLINALSVNNLVATCLGVTPGVLGLGLGAELLARFNWLIFL